GRGVAELAQGLGPRCGRIQARRDELRNAHREVEFDLLVHVARHAVWTGVEPKASVLRHGFTMHTLPSPRKGSPALGAMPAISFDARASYSDAEDSHGHARGWLGLRPRLPERRRRQPDLIRDRAAG